MRKTFGGALCAALLGGLALAALSGGATRTSVATLDGADARAAAHRATDTYTYKGSFKAAGPRATIKIKAKVQGGEVKAIKRMAYERLPAHCPVSVPPNRTISGGWTFHGGLTVNAKRKFKVVGTDGRPNPSSVRFSGRFSQGFSKVRGKFQTNSFFPSGPRETCSSFIKRYGAKR